MNKQYSQKTVIFGTHAVTQAWLNPERVINDFYVTEKVHAGFEETMTIAWKQKLRRAKAQIVERKFIDKKTKDAVHQGIMIECDPLEEIFVQDFIVKASNRDKAIFVVLDQVTDPHNVGAILRSASAFGALGLVMQRKFSPVLDGVLAKAASGAIEHIEVAYEINISRTLDIFRDNDFTVVGLDEHSEVEIAEFKPSAKIVLVLGAEGKGLRPSVSASCTNLVRLPTQGAIQSLNVSNAAAVALYALNSR